MAQVEAAFRILWERGAPVEQRALERIRPVLERAGWNLEENGPAHRELRAMIREAEEELPDDDAEALEQLMALKRAYRLIYDYAGGAQRIYWLAGDQLAQDHPDAPWLIS